MGHKSVSISPYFTLKGALKNPRSTTPDCRHCFLDPKLVQELGESESLHGQVVVQGGGTMDQPAVNESVSEEVRVCGVLVSEFLIQRVKGVKEDNASVNCNH